MVLCRTEQSVFIECVGMYLAAPLLKQRRASQLADRQLDWVLGSNPYNLCMMEGQGSFNPPYYLHRWAPNEPRGAVPGAIPMDFAGNKPAKTVRGSICTGRLALFLTTRQNLGAS